MKKRNIETAIKKYSKEYPALAVVGPRQSGKTTLVRYLFPRHTYISLENLDIRSHAREDPRGFLDDYGNYLILDEIQRVPELFSYLQERIDSNDHPGQYILTGSQQFLLMDNVSQTLAGRIITFHLYPFTVNELLEGQMDKNINTIFSVKKNHIPGGENIDVVHMLFTGMYPRIHDKNLTPEKWIENYVMTYIERDIRSLVNIENLRLFENFIKIAASHSGQVTNYASISNATGISQPTVKKWLSLLETSGIIFFLQPHHQNFNKRILKTPKIYFCDTGLLCFLLSIRNASELYNHPLYGNIFETFIISEFYKRLRHTGTIPPLHYWRDKSGNEIDLLVDFGKTLLPIEIKSSRTYNSDFKDTLRYWHNLKGNNVKKGFVLYNGESIIGSQSDIPTVPWWMM